jgi:fructoselysine-6-P-deglycase FrlB-like protein
VVGILGDADTPIAQAVDAVVALPFADEQSVVQTRFATTTLALLRASLGEDLEPVIAQAEQVLAAPAPPARYEHVAFLGTGWSVPLCHEAALKCREAARMHTEAYPVGEYQHGPIAVAGPGTLVWSLAPLPDALRASVEATGAEVRVAASDPLAELVAVHRLALATARARGIDPDAPAHLSRSVVLT